MCYKDYTSGWTIGGPNSGNNKIFLFFRHAHTGSGIHPVFCFMDMGDLSLAVKTAGA